MRASPREYWIHELWPISETIESRIEREGEKVGRKKYRERERGRGLGKFVRTLHRKADTEREPRSYKKGQHPRLRRWLALILWAAHHKPNTRWYIRVCMCVFLPKP